LVGNFTGHKLLCYFPNSYRANKLTEWFEKGDYLVIRQALNLYTSVEKLLALNPPRPPSRVERPTPPIPDPLAYGAHRTLSAHELLVLLHGTLSSDEISPLLRGMLPQKSSSSSPAERYRPTRSPSSRPSYPPPTRTSHYRTASSPAPSSKFTRWRAGALSPTSLLTDFLDGEKP
jgi:hypothetical protein